MSELEFGHAPLHKFSPRRKSTQINAAMLALIVVTVLIPIYGHHSTRNIRDALSEGADATTPAAVSEQASAAAMEALAQARTRWLSLGIAAAVLITFITIRLIHLGMKTVHMEIWIRRLGAGDLEYTVPVKGRDEIAEVGLALEKLRQSSIKAMQLDLVRKLSEGLEKKNEELERVLEELRRSQEQIVARQKLVELGELTAGVAHEIRNPLNFMKNFAVASEDLIEEMTEALDQLDSEHREIFTEVSRHLADNMNRIRTNSERVDRIVSDMIKIGRGGGRTQHVDITDLLTKQAQLAYQSHRAQDREFTMEIGTEFDADVAAVPMVPEDMARVFTNIVGNACFATAEKARQRGEAGEDGYMPSLLLSTKRRDDVVEIRIRDNGTGIPGDVVEKIFNPFFTTKDTDKGTGLGLSISHDIIRQHGGEITPQSVPGEYTEMVIRVPAKGGELAASA
ncbi:MAG: hypothetical protein F4139_14715 [Gemmatimonadetes bacterium]|nr:hypothetical protein [Gemmatimonadota bacterium]MYH54171.1 hypothetical protein [Gemmatimonadota bacterium]MYK67692.1 hypothetical protein [Gemmatimonadota bacterium]